MNEYHKIQSMYKRDRTTNALIEGDWTCPEFEYLAYNTWSFTEKFDGTNIRVMYDGQVRFGGRTNNAQIPTPLLNVLMDMFPADKFADSPHICLYGEGCGKGIQKGGGNYGDPTFVLFDVKVGNWWLRRQDVVDIAIKLEIKVVPIIGSGTLFEGVNMVKSGIKSTWGNFQAEGIVARPQTQLFGRNGERIITKIKCRDYGNL